MVNMRLITAEIVPANKLKQNNNTPNIIVKQLLSIFNKIMIIVD